MRFLRTGLRAALFLLPVYGVAAEPVPLQITEVAPVRFEKRGEVVFADFGEDAFGNLQIRFAEDPPAAALTVRLGEKLAADGTIDRRPPGSVNFREVPLAVRPGERTYRLAIPPKPFHERGQSVHTPPAVGEVTPFRYAEIEGAPAALDADGVRQLFVHAPFDDGAADFASSDETLDAVWRLCKHTMKATTAFGVYIDGERERIPYEADAYLNQLSHHACDLDPRVGRATLEYLLAHPTWPTEWSLHVPMIAAEDYRATGDLAFAAGHYEALKKKLLIEKARPDGLLRAYAIVDWPDAERDGYNEGKPDPKDRRQIGPEVNTVANAFFYHALRVTAVLAGALGKADDARDLEARAEGVREAFDRVFFDPARGVYVDGEGSAHASLHANLFALAFGLVPAGREDRVAAFVASRGMACSVYGAQYLLEALFRAGRDRDAVALLTARTRRSWWHMLELGSTMTLEAWDAQYKPNLTWNHAWGAAPANVLARFVLGVRPLEPGYRTILVAPQPGGLERYRGRVPTAAGPVAVEVGNAEVFQLTVDLPAGARARVELPRRWDGLVLMDGAVVAASATAHGLAVDGVGGGRHTFESR